MFNFIIKNAYKNMFNKKGVGSVYLEKKIVTYGGIKVPMPVFSIWWWEVIILYLLKLSCRLRSRRSSSNKCFKLWTLLTYIYFPEMGTEKHKVRNRNTRGFSNPPGK